MVRRRTSSEGSFSDRPHVSGGRPRLAQEQVRRHPSVPAVAGRERVDPYQPVVEPGCGFFCRLVATGPPDRFGGQVSDVHRDPAGATPMVRSVSR